MPRNPTRRRGRPPIPWQWEHIHAIVDALELHLGAGRHLTCYDSRTKQPCWILDARHNLGGHERAAAAAIQAFRQKRFKLTSCILALDHATRHPPAEPIGPYTEALEILTAWMRDYDRRLP